jgi:hypothetical protein
MHERKHLGGLVKVIIVAALVVGISVHGVLADEQYDAQQLVLGDEGEETEGVTTLPIDINVSTGAENLTVAADSDFENTTAVTKGNTTIIETAVDVVEIEPGADPTGLEVTKDGHLLDVLEFHTPQSYNSTYFNAVGTNATAGACTAAVVFETHHVSWDKTNLFADHTVYVKLEYETDFGETGEEDWHQNTTDTRRVTLFGGGETFSTQDYWGTEWSVWLYRTIGEDLEQAKEKMEEDETTDKAFFSLHADATCL